MLVKLRQNRFMLLEFRFKLTNFRAVAQDVVSAEELVDRFNPRFALRNLLLDFRCFAIGEFPLATVLRGLRDCGRNGAWLIPGNC
jgi:hypothetical protein